MPSILYTKWYVLHVKMMSFEFYEFLGSEGIASYNVPSIGASSIQ